MSDTWELLAGLAGKHRVTFLVEDGELGAVCICGWSDHAPPQDDDVADLIERVVRVALLHTHPSIPQE